MHLCITYYKICPTALHRKKKRPYPTKKAGILPTMKPHLADSDNLRNHTHGSEYTNVNGCKKAVAKLGYFHNFYLFCIF